MTQILDDFEPPKKKAKKRFAEPASAEEVAVITKGYTPSNTAKNTSWSVRVFQEWCIARKGCSKDEACNPHLIDSPDVESLNFWMPRFVAEVRRQDGKPYPPKTIHQILAGLQRYMLDKNPLFPQFLDQKNPIFIDIHRACDSVYRSLHQQGVGTAVRHASVISQAEEEQLWTSKVLGTDTPLSLQRAVFFYVGKCLCVRGGEEQRRLQPSMFVRSKDPDCYTYYERGSKNYSGGLKQLSRANKTVPCYAIPDNNPRCLVFLLDEYFKRLPKYAFEKDIFYLKHKPKAPVNEAEPWYESVPIGKNTLATMVKRMCQEAGIAEKTNHSLRATGATTLFQSGISERVIQKTTGHQSLESLRCYERVSEEQHQNVSRVLMPTCATASPSPDKSATKKTTASDSHGSTMFDQIFHGCSITAVTVNINQEKREDQKD